MPRISAWRRCTSTTVRRGWRRRTMTENDREIVETLLDIDPVGAFIQGSLDVDPDDDGLSGLLYDASNAFDDFLAAIRAAERRAEDMDKQERELHKALGADDDWHPERIPCSSVVFRRLPSLRRGRHRGSQRVYPGACPWFR